MLSDKELEIIRRKMAELEEDPPAHAWDKIKADIAPRQSYRPARWLAAAFLLMGLLTIAGLYYYNQPHKPVAAVGAGDQYIYKDEETEKETEVIPEAELGSGSGMAEEKEPVKVSEQEKTVLNRKPEATSAAIRSGIAQGQVPGDAVQKRIAVKRNGKKKRVLEKVNGIKNFTSRNAFYADTSAIVARLLNPYQLNKAAVTAENNKSGHAGKPDSLQTIVNADSVAAKQVVAAPDSSSKKGQKVWALGFLVAPKYASKIFVPTTTDNTLITRLDNRNKVNSSRTGIELGLLFTKSLTKQLHVEAGISWLKLQEYMSYTYSAGIIDTVHYTQISSNSLKVKTFDKLENRALISSYMYGGGRIDLIYYFRERPNSRLNLSWSGGGNLLLKSKTKQFFNGELYQPLAVAGTDSLMNQSNYNLAVGVGYNRRVSNALEIMLMPSFSYFLGSIYIKQEPYRLRPYFLSLNITLKRHFRKK